MIDGAFEFHGKQLERRLPAGARLMRLGAWCWYRTEDDELHELVLPDDVVGDVTDDEVRAILAGERRAS